VTPEEVAVAERDLARRDPVLGYLIEVAGPCPLQADRSHGSHFEYLARSICYQQLAGRAAATIWGRVRALVPGAFTAPKILALDFAVLRAAGLSNAKALSLVDLASRLDGGALRLAGIGRQDDDAVIAALSAVRGIGPWTAQMFLLFRLGRPDVWPVGDFGVRAGVAAGWKLPAMPTPAALIAFGEPFRPYRSLVAWYAWRALERDREGLPTSR
jgi:DNA-3-methyladenine glycosylase II